MLILFLRFANLPIKLLVFSYLVVSDNASFLGQLSMITYVSMFMLTLTTSYPAGKFLARYKNGDVKYSGQEIKYIGYIFSSGLILTSVSYLIVPVDISIILYMFVISVDMVAAEVARLNYFSGRALQSALVHFLRTSSPLILFALYFAKFEVFSLDVFSVLYIFGCTIGLVIFLRNDFSLVRTSSEKSIDYIGAKRYLFSSIASRIFEFSPFAYFMFVHDDNTLGQFSYLLAMCSAINALVQYTVVQSVVTKIGNLSELDFFTKVLAKCIIAMLVLYGGLGLAILFVCKNLEILPTIYIPNYFIVIFAISQIVYFLFSLVSLRHFDQPRSEVLYMTYFICLVVYCTMLLIGKITTAYTVFCVLLTLSVIYYYIVVLTRTEFYER